MKLEERFKKWLRKKLGWQEMSDWLGERHELFEAMARYDKQRWTRENPGKIYSYVDGFNRIKEKIIQFELH